MLSIAGRPSLNPGQMAKTGDARAPVGSEKPIAMWERLAEGPRDNHGGVAGGIMCPGEEPERGHVAVRGSAWDDSRGVGHAMVWIRRTERREGPSSVNRRSGCPAGVAVMDPANLRMCDYLAQFGWLNRPAIRGVAVQCTAGP